MEDNDWPELPVAALGELGSQAAERVSIVTSARDSVHLDRLVAALEQQSYPTGSTECVVVVEQGERAIVAPPTRALRVRLVTTSGEGFGAGRARDLGAAAADGDVLIFLDPDVVPCHRLVEAHARWHHVTADAVVVGGLRMSAVHDVPDLTSALRAGPADGILADLPWEPAPGSGTARRRSNEMTARRADIWTAVVGANLSVRRETFERVGGFTEFGVRAVEDIDFGFRTFLDGAVLVPDAAAFGWQPGPRESGEPRASEPSERRRALLLEQYAPLAKVRTAPRHRAAIAPWVTIHLDATTSRVERVVASVESVLADRGDAVVLVTTDPSHPDTHLLAEAFAGEGRVRLDPEDHGPFRVDRSPVHVLLSEPVAFRAGGLIALCGPLASNVTGVVRTTEPHRVVTAVATRAWSRAGRLAERGTTPYPSADDEVLALAARWFGSRWVAPEELITSASPPRPPAMGPRRAVHPSPDDAPDRRKHAARGETDTDPARPLRLEELRAIGEEQRAVDALRRAEDQIAAHDGHVRSLASQLDRLRSRRIVRFADRLGRLRRGTRG